ncbi:MAG: ATP synthase subunit I [Gammaproteobacteria bacterium]|jgi:ATP synthase protein I|nr:ATP synthase subunit I [Gammaproteobacteria bacterium]
MRTILSIQAFLTAAAAAAGYFYGGTPAALAALFGAATALSNTLLLAWRLQRGKRQIHADAHRHLRSFYFSSIERLFVVGGLLAVGIGALQLTPLPLMAAFVAGQMAWMFSWIDHGRKT